MPYDNEYERLLTWFGKSPTWLQEAAKKLLTEHKPFSEKDITRFADTCMGERTKSWIGNGPGYRSGEFNALLESEGARHVCTRAYSLWQNGKVERMNRTLAQEW